MFEFDYQLTKEDYVEFNQYHYKNSKSFMKDIMLLRVLFPILLLLFPVLMGKKLDMIYISIFVLISTVWIIFLPKYLWKAINKKIIKMVEENKNGDLFTLKHTTINESGVYWKSEYSEGHYNWNSVIKINETDQFIYIYVSSVQAVVISKQLSSNGIDIMKLLEFCKSMVNRNNGREVKG
jgi:hypothetical protein